MVNSYTPIFVNGEFWRTLTTAEAERAERCQLILGVVERTPASNWPNNIRTEWARCKQVVFQKMDDPYEYLYLNDDDIYIEEGGIWLKPQ